MRPFGAVAILVPLALAACTSTCGARTTPDSGPSSSSAAPGAVAGAAVEPGASEAEARFAWSADLPLGRPDAASIRNVEGSPRINEPAAFGAFYEQVAPELVRWAAEPGLLINPNFVAALFAKESGFEPFATSWTPANGIAQLTHIADQDLRTIVGGAAGWRWMQPEVEQWPRHPIVHRSDARKTQIDSLVAAGLITGENEYFFAPLTAARAALFWLRLIAEAWTADEWPGAHGSYVRHALNDGDPLSDAQLLDLVAVSYNQGHPYVRELIERHGTSWSRHLNDEAADYLERVRHYTILFQAAPRALD